ncbi:MAG: hypothetical protein AAGF95_27290 [Chloroflexota bacterium]
MRGVFRVCPTPLILIIAINLLLLPARPEVFALGYLSVPIILVYPAIRKNELLFLEE